MSLCKTLCSAQGMPGGCPGDARGMPGGCQGDARGMPGVCLGDARPGGCLLHHEA
jgi:hypothetical protein